MLREAGRVEIFEIPVAVQTETEMSGEPPLGWVGIGSGLSGNGGDIPPAFRNAFGKDEPPRSNRVD